MWQLLVGSAIFAALCGGPPARAATLPTVSVGSGPSMVVEYDLNFHPLRAYRGFVNPSDITALADDAILLVDEGARQVVLFEPDGTVRWRAHIGDLPIRARPRPGGGWLVTSVNEIIALRPDRSVEWRFPVEHPGAAVPLRNGNVLLVRNEGNGLLVETTPQGAVVWKSGPRGLLDAAGRWIDAAPDSYFLSVRSLDVGVDGTVFITDFDRHQLRLLAPDYRTLRTIAGPHHMTDTRIGPDGDLVAVSPEDYVVWLELRDGTTRTFETPLRPKCATITRHGTLLVGMQWEPEAAVLNATAARRAGDPMRPWRQRMLPFAGGAVVFALAVAVVVRRRDLLAWVGGGAVDVPVEGGAAVPSHLGDSVRRAWVAVAILALVGASYGAWHAVGAIEAAGFRGPPWQFLLCCTVAGVVLRLLNAALGVRASLTSFVPTAWPGAAPLSDGRRVAFLGVLAVASTVACVSMVRLRTREQPIAVALWLAAQIWVVAAALPPRRPARGARAPWWVGGTLVLILLAAIGLRIWQIGYFPDYVHHDHSIFGEAAFATLRGAWTQFFERVYSIGRPWLALTGGALWLFGMEYWVLRLTAAVSGILTVWGTYLLGSVLFNRRSGVVAAALVTVNQLLLLYARQPYVMEPVAPFVLGLYCVVAGLQRGSRLHWGVGGLLCGWALLAYYAAVVYAVVGLAVFAYMVVRYPRAMWQQRSGLLWFVAAACVVYVPMLAATTADASVGARASSIVVFLNPDGSLRWDAGLWTHQLSRAFGSIIYYGDSQPWGVGTGKSICMRAGSCVFGIGAAYLMTVWRTPATFLLLAWIGLGIFFGTATLPDPPTHYHDLAAIIPIMLVSAVAVDRALALADGRRRVCRLLAATGAVALVGLIAAAHLDAVWNAVRRPAVPVGARPMLRADLKTTVARLIGRDPHPRYFLVRSRSDVSCPDPIFAFVAAQTDVSDLTTDLAVSLPVPPVEPASGAVFIVLPSRADDRRGIAEIYPGVVAEEVPYYPGIPSIWVYRVDAAAVRRAAAGAGS